MRASREDPYRGFARIVCLNADAQRARWLRMRGLFELYGMREVTRFAALETPGNHHVGCALSHREIVRRAHADGLPNVLVFEDDVVFRRDHVTLLARSLEDLERFGEFDLFYLGGTSHEPESIRPEAELTNLRRVRGGLTCTHAICYGRGSYATLLEALPSDPEGMREWLERWHGVDQWLAAWQRETHSRVVVCHPMLAIQEAHLAYLGEVNERPRDYDLRLLPGYLGERSADSGGPAAAGPELELLLLCGAGEVSPERRDRVRALLSQPLDWRELAEEALFHGVAAPVSQAIEREFPGALPEEVRSSFEVFRERAGEDNERLLEALADVTQLLNARGVVSLPLAGPWLGERHADARGSRVWRSLELALPVAQRERALGAVAEMEFLPVHDPDIGRLSPRAMIECVDAARGVTIELHTHLSFPRLALELDAVGFLERASDTAFRGVSIRALDAGDELLLLCARGAADGFTRLCQIRDVATVLSGSVPIRWSELEPRLRRAGCVSLVQLGLLLAERGLGVALEPAAARLAHAGDRARVLADELCAAFVASGVRHAGLHGSRLRSLRERRSDRLRVLVGSLAREIRRRMPNL